MGGGRVALALMGWCAAAVLICCGDDLGGARDGMTDAGEPDGGPLGLCTLAACSNGIDDDGDGFVEGADPDCMGPWDLDEGSFRSGIPSNVDPKWQDCFFDGNSGSGDDGCRVHTCCQLGATGGEDCVVDRNFDPARDCFEQTEQCSSFCQPLTPVGCDCFGCCTVCDPESGDCADVLVNPHVAQGCFSGAVTDETRCPTCIKNSDCSAAPCDPDGCVLCRGQSLEDLPDQCGGVNLCPDSIRCESGLECDECGATGYCSTGCCVAAVQ
jgi:hypothetical protein